MTKNHLHPFERQVYKLGFWILILTLFLAGFGLWLYFTNRDAIQRNGALLTQLHQESDRQDSQLTRAVYILCIKLGEKPKACFKFTQGLLLANNFDAAALRRAGRVEALVGPRGLKGLPGLSTVIFRAGPKGLKGRQGRQGVQGIRGNQGFRGVTGKRGLRGVRGPQGVQGVQGVQGLPGPIGPRGVPGPTTCPPGYTGTPAVLRLNPNGAINVWVCIKQ
jgi:hypothetical protein